MSRSISGEEATKGYSLPAIFIFMLCPILVFKQGDAFVYLLYESLDFLLCRGLVTGGSKGFRKLQIVNLLLQITDAFSAS